MPGGVVPGVIVTSPGLFPITIGVPLSVSLLVTGVVVPPDVVV